MGENFIIGGDFITTLYSEIDKKGGGVLAMEKLNQD